MRIEILITKDEGAFGRGAALIRGEESSRVAEVEKARGRGGYTAAIGGGHAISLMGEGVGALLPGFPLT